MVRNTPRAEIAIDEELVRSLLREQASELAELPLTHIGHGWDNAMYRLGDARLVRLPRREVAAPLIVAEQRCLPELAERLPIPVPVPLVCGKAQGDYPWSWCVLPYFEGRAAHTASLEDPSASATELGTFLGCLHELAPPDAPRNAVRGIPLEERSASFETCLELLPDPLDGRAHSTLRELWAEALRVEPFAGPPLWLHGDLHAGNILVHEGRWSAVIDWGDICSGVPAYDFAIAWMCFEREDRERLRAAAGGVDEATWLRARGWGLNLSVMAIANSADDPDLKRLARTLLERVTRDALEGD